MPEELPREPDVEELVRRFQEARARRRRARLFTSAVATITLMAVLAVVVVLVLSRDSPDNKDGDPSVGMPSSSTGSVPSTTATTMSTVSSATGHTTTSSPASTAGDVTTLAPPPPTTSPPPITLPSSTATTAPPSRGLVVLDPGHQARGDPGQEPIGPGSSTTKAKVSDGTVGTVTGTPESELVLSIALQLRDALTARGVQVVMTRTSQDVSLSNIQRAEIANQAGADLFVRIHADGNQDPAVAGIHVLYPASIAGWTDDVAAASKRAALLAQQGLIAATGAQDRGIDARGDLTGFNWSDVPVILPEIGFMTNPAEDRLLATAAYQAKIVDGLAQAIGGFLQAGPD